MTGTLWDAARTARARLRSFFDAPLASDAAPLELLHAALDELERKAQPSGRGSRVFPYTRVVVRVAQGGADRAAIEAVFAGLDERLRERLTEIRCSMPPSIAASVAVDDGAHGAPLVRVECSGDPDVSARAPASLQLPELRLHVVKGQCARADYTFSGGVVAIGRGADPSDAFGRVRRNDVAFLDARDGATETVARAHARIELDPALGAYVVFDEASSNPTYVVRGGRSMRVSPRDPRGVRLQSGDELLIGRAVIGVSID